MSAFGQDSRFPSVAKPWCCQGTSQLYSTICWLFVTLCFSWVPQLIWVLPKLEYVDGPTPVPSIQLNP